MSYECCDISEMHTQAGTITQTDAYTHTYTQIYTHTHTHTQTHMHTHRHRHQQSGIYNKRILKVKIKAKARTRNTEEVQIILSTTRTFDFLMINRMGMPSSLKSCCILFLRNLSKNPGSSFVLQNRAKVGGRDFICKLSC